MNVRIFQALCVSGLLIFFLECIGAGTAPWQTCTDEYAV